MRIINKCLTKKEFENYVKKKEFSRKIDKIILHHTNDTLGQWKRGEVSINYYKKLYESKGWKTGPHLFVASEGIYLFTDINIQGTHANAGNKGSIGIELIGNYDKRPPHGKTWDNTKKVLKILLSKFNLKLKDIHFHRKYNPKKSCPGKAITQRWVHSELSHFSVRRLR